MGSVENEPLPGENLVLTIDANIQYMAERALDAQMAKMKALHGTVVVQDPHTGQILALAVSPRFNPNDSRHMEPGSLKNLAVSDVYEPGSTFKLVTYSAAIDGAGVQPTDMVDCQGGAMTMYGRTLHDDKSDHYRRDHGAVGAGALERRGRGEDGAEAGAAEVLRLHAGVRVWRPVGHRAAERDARAAARAEEVGIDEHSVAGDRAGDWRDAGAAGDDGVRDCEWRDVYAAACAAAVDRRDEGRSAAEAGGVPSGDQTCRRSCRMGRTA